MKNYNLNPINRFQDDELTRSIENLGLDDIRNTNIFDNSSWDRNNHAQIDFDTSDFWE